MGIPNILQLKNCLLGIWAYTFSCQKTSLHSVLLCKKVHIAILEGIADTFKVHLVEMDQ